MVENIIDNQTCPELHILVFPLWFETISFESIATFEDRTKAEGFTQSKLGPCILLNGKVVFLIYADNYLFYAISNNKITAVLKDIENIQVTTNIRSLRKTKRTTLQDSLGSTLTSIKKRMERFTQLNSPK